LSAKITGKRIAIGFYNRRMAALDPERIARR